MAKAIRNTTPLNSTWQTQAYVDDIITSNTSVASGSSNISNYSSNTLGYISTQPAYLSTDNFYTYNNNDLILDNSFRNILFALTEKELAKLCSVLRERLTAEEYKSIMTSVVTYRHLTEPFIMEYAANLSKDTYYIMHKADIVSKAYPQLALMIESQNI